MAKRKRRTRDYIAGHRTTPRGPRPRAERPHHAGVRPATPGPQPNGRAPAHAPQRRTAAAEQRRRDHRPLRLLDNVAHRARRARQRAVQHRPRGHRSRGRPDRQVGGDQRRTRHPDSRDRRGRKADPANVQRREPNPGQLWRRRKQEERDGRHRCRIDEKVRRIDSRTLHVPGIGEVRTKDNLSEDLDVRSCVIPTRGAHSRSAGGRARRPRRQVVRDPRTDAGRAPSTETGRRGPDVQDPRRGAARQAAAEEPGRTSRRRRTRPRGRQQPHHRRSHREGRNVPARP